MTTDSDRAFADLLDLAEENGHLTQADILAAFPAAATDADLMETLNTRLRGEGVDIEEPQEPEEETLDADLDQVSSAEANMVTDSVRLYLREISRAPVLTA